MSEDTPTKTPDIPYKTGFNAEYQGKAAECDGGQHVVGNLSGRQDFSGILTGDFRDYGNYPWRWYLMSNLVYKPQGFEHEAVWCDEGSLVFL